MSSDLDFSRIPHPLPEALRELMQQGKWQGALQVRWPVGSPVIAELRALNLEAMIDETAALVRIAAKPSLAALYGFDKAGVRDAVDPRLLVCIAMNWEEEGLVLDYRQGPSPSVLCMSAGPQRIIFSPLADTFEDFAHTLAT